MLFAPVGGEDGVGQGHQGGARGVKVVVAKDNVKKQLEAKVTIAPPVTIMVLIGPVNFGSFLQIQKMFSV